MLGDGESGVMDFSIHGLFRLFGEYDGMRTMVRGVWVGVGMGWSTMVLV